jgi:iron complex outermembrane recepter protein
MLSGEVMKSVQKLAMLSSVSALAMLAASAGPVLAQNNSQTAQASTGLEEIVVTARKREEALLDIPVAITAFSAGDIEKAQIFDMREITKFSPGLTFQNTGGNGPGGRGQPYIIFRGMTGSSTIPRRQTGAVFIDGIYVLGGTNAVNTVDVERVEVIKGPQNAYFGRNTFGGAVNFITKNPGDTFEGQVSANASTRDSYDANLSVEGPLVAGKLAGRLSTVLHKKGAHYTATDGGELGEETTQSITATLYATPTENFWVRLRGSYQEDDDGPPTSSHLTAALHGQADTSCAGKTFSAFDAVTRAPRTFQVSLPYFCNRVPTIKDLGERVVTSNTSLRSPFLTSLGNPDGLINGFINNQFNIPLLSDAPRRDKFGLTREMKRFTAQAEYEFANGISAGLNFGYEDTGTNAISDPDRSDVENVYTVNPSVFETYTVEARVQSAQDQPLRWLVGGTLYDGDFDAHFNGSLQYQSRTFRIFTVGATRGQTVPFATTLAPNLPFNRDGERASVKAGFAALEYDLNEQISFTGEIRYQKDRSKLQPSAATSLSASFKDWLPRVIAEYKPVDNWTVYASWSRGTLPGQFNAQYITATASERRDLEAVFPGVAEVVASEKVDNFELGSKQQLLDGRLQYTLAVYKMKWKNIQASAAFVAPSTARTLTGVVIPGDADLKGVEFESTAMVTDEWDVNFRMGWQEGTYTNLVQPFLAQLTQNVTRYDGNHIARVPDFTGSLASTYRTELTPDWDWYVRGDVNYTGKAWDSEANLVKMNDYIRANARFGVENDNLLIELFATNLFNDKNWNYGFRNVYQGTAGGIFVELPSQFFPPTGTPPVPQQNFPQGIIVEPPDKREFGIRMRYNF